MFENVINFFKNLRKSEKKVNNSKDTAKERLHLVLMQDRANVSADFLDLMKQEIIEVIKKYVDVEESEIDVRMTNKQNEDGTNGAPALYANIPIINIKSEMLVEKKQESAGEENAEKDKEDKEKQDNIQNVENKESKENKEEKEIKLEASDTENNTYNNQEKNTEEKNEPIKEAENIKEAVSQE